MQHIRMAYFFIAVEYPGFIMRARMQAERRRYRPMQFNDLARGLHGRGNVPQRSQAEFYSARLPPEAPQLERAHQPAPNRGKWGDAKAPSLHNRVVNISLCQRLIVPVLLCASLAGAAEPSADIPSDAGCQSLLAVVLRSLEEEIGTACPAATSLPEALPVACAAQREPLRAIAEFIGKRSATNADKCETLLEVNKLLRELPPKG